MTARWNAADGAGLIAVLDRVRSTEAKMTTSPVGPIAGLPQNAPATFRELLMHDAGGTAETKLGRDLVLGTRKVTDLSSAADTQRAIMNLRRLDDVLVRIIAAHDVAALTGASLEDVLALYRTEGDLGVPVDDASLKRGVPPGRADQSTHLNPEPDISHLVWIVRDSAFSAACGDVVLQDWALIQWMIQLAGLDDLGRDFGNFGTWSSANWRDAGRVDSPATATARWHAERSRFVVDRDRASHTGASRAHVASVSDPLALVKAILVEGVFFLLRLGRVESLVGPLDAAHPLHGTRLSPGLTYLHYHAQRSGSSDMRNDLPMPKLKGMLLSGLSAAATKGTAALRKAIADVAAVKQVLVDVKPAIEGTDPAATIAAAEAHWAVIEGWLRTDANLALLSGFVESADATAWHGWTELRGNMSRYRVLREYYRLLVAGP